MGPTRKNRLTCEYCGCNFHRNYLKRHKCVNAHDSSIVTPKKKKKVLCENITIDLPVDNCDEGSCSLQQNEVQTEGNNRDVEDLEDFVFTETEESDVEIDDEPFDTANTVDQEANLTLFVLNHFILKWQSIFKISSNAIEYLLTFLHLLFLFVARFTLKVPSHFKLRSNIPPNVTAHKKYVVCKKCYTLYNFEDCIYVVEGKEEARKCQKILFPRHTQAARQQMCNGDLLYCGKTSDGKLKFRPHHEFCYRSIKDSLQELTMRPSTKELCNKWRTRQVLPDTYGDIYDGALWQLLEKKKYFDDENSLCVLLNVDWFQPYDRTCYSVGVIYLVLLNLPREERLKKENIIIVGVIPHLGKEPSTINSFLQPMVDELREAFTSGLMIYSHLSPTEKKKYRVLLLCVSRDLPAIRKVCGFLGHSARLGCSKCLHNFQFDENGHQSCGNYDSINVKKRTNKQHREDVTNIQKMGVTPTSRKALESQYGARYSVLLELPYLDIIRCHAVDGMHNLLLGTAKRITTEWISRKLLTHKDLEEMQEDMSRFIVPSTIGRSHYKIISGMSSFTAEEWMNWTKIYSLIVLKNRLPNVHYQVWQLFVRAFCLICQKSVKKINIRKATILFGVFVKKCEQLYGESFISTNMHMHMHLEETIFDFGPLYSTWCFALERMNGLFGKQPNNNKRIEEQILIKLLTEMYMCSENEKLSETYPNCDFENLVSFVTKFCSKKGFKKNDITCDNELHETMTIAHLADVQGFEWSIPDTPIEVTTSKSQRVNLTAWDTNNMHTMYKFILKGKEISLSDFAYLHRKIQCRGVVYGCRNCGAPSSSFVLANWYNFENGVDCEFRPGQISHLYTHIISVDGITKKFLLAKVDWFQTLEYTKAMRFGHPVTAYSAQFEVEGPSTWIPVQRIRCKCACIFRSNHNDREIVISPLY